MNHWFKNWFKRFWDYHGDRIIFVGLSLAIAAFLFRFVPDMKEESKTVVIGIMMLLYNYARSNNEKEKQEDYHTIMQKVIDEIKKNEDEKKKIENKKGAITNE